MGQKYTNIVLLCLQCLDSPAATVVTATEDLTGEAGKGAAENAGAMLLGEGERGKGRAVFDDLDVYDEDGIIVGVRYIERILLRMQEISI